LVRSLAAAASADAIVCFGGPGPNVALAAIARERNIPVVVIWAGSDICQVLQKRIALEVVKREEYVNVADGEWLVGELAELGIEAEYCPVTAIRPGRPVAPLPQTFRVLTYLPEPRRDFYSAEQTYALARRLPEMHFEVVGPGKPDPRAPHNVSFSGFVLDVDRRLDDSTVLLRLPEHDGKSMFVLEALSRARHVVWNRDFPCVNYAPAFDDAYGHLRVLAAAHASGELQPNLAGREFVLHNFMRDRIGTGFIAVLDREAARYERRFRGIAARRAVISGLDLFCSAVANEINEKHEPAWRVDILRTGSRLEVLTSIINLARAEVWYSIGSPVTDRWLDAFARLLHKKRLIHWVGSDIELLKKRPGLLRTMRRRNILHLTEVAWTQRELADLGIRSRIAPLPPRNPAKRITPLPEEFTVLLYVPKTRASFYGSKQYGRLIREFPDIRFLIAGGGAVDVPQCANAVNLGWSHDLAKTYERSSVLVRFTERDGLSLMVLEALSYGRHVLWTQTFPATRFVRDYTEMRDQIRALYELHRAGRLALNAEGIALVANRYSIARCMDDIVKAWDDLIAGTTLENPQPEWVRVTEATVAASDRPL
jgi:glycosyltransferase involved in cell wall biosynthesis